MKIALFLPITNHQKSFWTGVGAGLIAGAASLYGGSSSNSANASMNRVNREFQSHQSHVQRDWQQRMSSTAVERHTNDMRRAGLNPILAAGGSASSGPSPVPSGSMTQIKDEITPAISSALGAKRLNQEIKNMKATKNLTEAQETVAAVEQQKKIVEMDQTKAMTAIMQSQGAERRAEEALYEGKGGKWLKLFEKFFGSGAGSSATSLIKGKR